eukprot:PhM_4_TR2819/c0_g1_i1/m.94240
MTTSLKDLNWEDDPITTLYHVLARSIEEPDLAAVVRFPANVIVYEHYYPKVWFSTVKKGVVVAKTGRDLGDSKRLYDAFVQQSGVREFEEDPEDGSLRPVVVHDAVAEFIGYSEEVPAFPNTPEGTAMSMAWSTHIRKVSRVAASVAGYSEDKSAVAFFTPTLLAQFLRDRRVRPRSGALIQFMAPSRGRRNTVTQVSWLGSVSMVQRRSNVHDFRDDVRVPLYQRYIADRMYMGHTEEQECAGSMQQKLDMVTGKIAGIITRTFKGFDLHNLRIYYKVTTGDEDELCFLYSTFMDLRRIKSGQVPVLERSTLNEQFTFFRTVMAPTFEARSKHNALSAHEKYLLRRLRRLCDAVDGYRDETGHFVATGSSSPGKEGGEQRSTTSEFEKNVAPEDISLIPFPTQDDDNKPTTSRKDHSAASSSKFVASVRMARDPRRWRQELRRHINETRPDSTTRTFTASPAHAPTLRDRSRVMRSANDPRGVPSCYRGIDEVVPSWCPTKFKGNESRTTFRFSKKGTK